MLGCTDDCRGPCHAPPAVALINTIVGESTGPTCDGVVDDGGHNLQFPDNSCGGTIPVLGPRLDPAGPR